MYNQKTAHLDAQEMMIREENLKAREHIDYEGLKRLQSAICLKAVADYKSALRGKKVDGRLPENVRKECEEFFKSDMFKATTGIHDPQKAIDAIRAVPSGYEKTLQMKK